MNNMVRRMTPTERIQIEFASRSNLLFATLILCLVSSSKANAQISDPSMLYEKYKTLRSAEYLDNVHIVVEESYPAPITLGKTIHRNIDWKSRGAQYIYQETDDTNLYLHSWNGELFVRGGAGLGSDYDSKNWGYIIDSKQDSEGTAIRLRLFDYLDIRTLSDPKNRLTLAVGNDQKSLNLEIPNRPGSVIERIGFSDVSTLSVEKIERLDPSSHVVLQTIQYGKWRNFDKSLFLPTEVTVTNSSGAKRSLTILSANKFDSAKEEFVASLPYKENVFLQNNLTSPSESIRITSLDQNLIFQRKYKLALQLGPDRVFRGQLPK